MVNKFLQSCLLVSIMLLVLQQVICESSLVHVKVHDNIMLTTNFLESITKALELQDYRKDITFHSGEQNQVLTCRIDNVLFESFQKGIADTFLLHNVESMKKLTAREKRNFEYLTLEDLQQDNIVVYMGSKSRQFRTLTDESPMGNDMKNYLLERVNFIRTQYLTKFQTRFIKTVNSLNINQVLNDIRYNSDSFVQEKIPNSVRTNMHRRDLDFSHQVMHWVQEEIANMYDLKWEVDKFGQLTLGLTNFNIGVWKEVLKMNSNNNNQQTISPGRRQLMQREQFKQIPSLSHLFESLSKGLAKDLLSLLENHPNVDFITKQRAAETTNIELNKVVQSGYGSNGTYFWNYGYDGTGEVVSITDTGLDTEHCFFKGITSENYTVYNPNNRKVLFYDDDFKQGDYVDNTGHGTSVAGIIAGNPDARNGNYTATSFAEAGVAKEAKLYIIDAYNSKTGGLWVTSIPSYLTTAYSMTGATISSNSYAFSNTYSCSFDCVCKQTLANGTQVPITDKECYASYGRRCCQLAMSYTTQSYQVDYTLNLYDEFVFVAASGNEGAISMNSSMGGVVAKSAITVGASSGTSLAGFSGRGPTLDGRFKPDIVSPTGVITSTKGTVCGLAGFGGTSCSTPGVAGTAALVRHYFNKDKKKNLFKYEISNTTMSASVKLSGSLVKAAIIHSAEALTGTADHVGSLANIPVPNIYTGYGRMNLRNALLISEDPSSVSLLGNLFVVNREYLETGSSTTFMFTTNVENATIKSTITWYDLPSNAEYSGYYGKKLINDIDLKVVTISGTSTKTYYGNGNVNGNTVDSINSVEKLSVQNIPLNTTVIVTVSAKSTNKGKQAYSMIITGNLKRSTAPPPVVSTITPQTSKGLNPQTSTVLNPTNSNVLNRTVENQANGLSGILFVVIILMIFTTFLFV